MPNGTKRQVLCSVAVLLLAVSFGRPGHPIAGRQPQTDLRARRIQFVDVAGRSAIRYISNNSFTGRKYFPQPMCGGIALLDYNNDGRLDIFFTNGAKLPELKKPDASFYNCLLENKGDGRYEDEGPVHEVHLSSFLMSATPVTWWQFGLFCLRTNRRLASDAGFAERFGR